jgi:hypothetical protein
MRRKPVAFLRLRETFLIDEKGVIFYPRQIEGLELPVISGLESKITYAKQGRRVVVRETVFALKLIKEISKDKVLSKYKLAKIDVANLPNSLIILNLPLQKQESPDIKTEPVIQNQGIEIKFGAENVADKLSALSNIFGATGNDVNTIKYIDLRFRDPLIKFNDVKPKTK